MTKQEMLSEMAKVSKELKRLSKSELPGTAMHLVAANEALGRAAVALFKEGK